MMTDEEAIKAFLEQGGAIRKYESIKPQPRNNKRKIDSTRGGYSRLGAKLAKESGGKYS